MASNSAPRTESNTVAVKRKPFIWSYGVTTVDRNHHGIETKRLITTLPTTITSLKAAGFDNPHLFVDGCTPDRAVEVKKWLKEEHGIDGGISIRSPNIRTHGNWFLTAMELFIRSPNADRYAIFQDDFITYRNLRGYLEWCGYPDDRVTGDNYSRCFREGRGYLNLYTFPSNQTLAPRNQHGGTIEGWYKSNQFGRGAVALVFNRECLLTLLQSKHMVERPLDAHRGHKAVDGGIVTSLKKEGWIEYVHTPSLTQHIGDISSMGNKPHLKAESFKGESFDAMELVGMVEKCRT